MSQARTANIDIQYNGKNITTKLSECLKSFTYTDVASGQSDSISINLSDVDRRWIGSWFPSKGDKMIAKIKTKNWSKEGDSNVFTCGSFVIDDFGFSGFPINGIIGGISIPVTEGFKATIRTKTWKSVTIKSIASEVAKRASVELIYEAQSITIKSIEQSGQTDCEFLYRLCETYGLAMKVYYNKIIIYDEGTYEKKKSVVILYESDLLNWNYKTTLTGTYTGAEISYTNPKKGKSIKVKIGNGNRILKINETADNYKDAELKSRAKINSANKKMTTLRITIKANPKIVATSNITIKGMGKIDGKYAVEKVKHSIGSGYTMAIDLRLIQRLSGNEDKESTGNYVVKKGDSLWTISKKYYNTGTKHNAIYLANKDTIEKAAKANGKANSQNGNIIYPGTILTIPQ